MLLFGSSNILFHVDSEDLSDVLSLIFVLEHDFTLLRKTLDIELFLLVLKLSESLRRFLFLLEWGLNHFDDGDLIWQEVDDEISLKISDCFAI